MELLTSILSKDFIDLAPPDANAPEEGTFFPKRKLTFQKNRIFQAWLRQPSGLGRESSPAFKSVCHCLCERESFGKYKK